MVQDDQPSSLLAAEIVSRLVGVIDLQNGRAVHARLGDRDQYRPVEFCGGSPLTLAEHYRELGVGSLYLADLDSIGGSEVQAAIIERMAGAADGWGDAESEMLLDLGWSGRESNRARSVMAGLAKEHPQIRWIAATESCLSISALDELAELVSPHRLLLGLDFRRGQLVTRCAETEPGWIDRAVELGLGGAVILDLASVGSSGGVVTAEACRRVRRRGSDLKIYSGGGIRRSEDVRRLTAAGCDACLIATALHP